MKRASIIVDKEIYLELVKIKLQLTIKRRKVVSMSKVIDYLLTKKVIGE